MYQKKSVSYINKKRKIDDKIDKIEENTPEIDKNEEKTAKMKDEETKENNNENPNVKTFIIDDSLKSVQTVK